MNKIAPLPHRLRPEDLDGLMGQKEARAFVTDFVDGEHRSALLWGPPGCGKTSAAHLIELSDPKHFFMVSAVNNGVAEIRRITDLARTLDYTPIIFVDEIHRFTRVQQDSLLPIVEDGTVVLIGATTENPSFTITAPLLSRLRLIRLESLTDEAMQAILERALETDEQLKSLGRKLDPEVLPALARAAAGDARAGLGLLETVLVKVGRDYITLEDVGKLLDRPMYHDRSGDSHYDLISAFQKSIRASDVDGGVYWLGRMLAGGEDPRYILRRLIRIAAEDVGLAEPHALQVALSAKNGYESLGSPEGDICLYQATVYLACAPKSNALELTEIKVKKLIKATGAPPVPMHLRNAPTRLMAELGHGKGYIYAHDDPAGALTLNYLPEGLKTSGLYQPKPSGFEKRLKEIINAREQAKKARTRQTRRPGDQKG